MRSWLNPIFAAQNFTLSTIITALIYTIHFIIKKEINIIIKMWRLYFVPLFILTGLYQFYKGEITFRQYLDMAFLDILMSIGITLTVNSLISLFYNK